MPNGIGKENMILSRDIVLREDFMGTHYEDEDMESNGGDQEDLSWKEVSSKNSANVWVYRWKVLKGNFWS